MKRNLCKKSILTIGLMIALILYAGRLFAQDQETNEELVEKYKAALMPKMLTRGMKGVTEKPSLVLNLNFKLNSFELEPQEVRYLNALGQSLQDVPLRKNIYRIEGYTCNLGSDEYNLGLSRKRAQTVVDYLAQNFKFPRAQFKVEGFGVNNPVAPNTTEEGREKNRRVIIINTLREVDGTSGTEGTNGTDQKSETEGISSTDQKPHETSRPDPESEVTSKTDQKSEEIGRTERLEIAVNAKYTKDKDKGARELVEGAILTSKDSYCVEFEPQTTAYIYIYQVSPSKGSRELLFPNSKFSKMSNPVMPGKVYRVPEFGKWFYLDDNKGTEHIVVIGKSEEVKDAVKVCDKVLGPSNLENTKNSKYTRTASVITPVTQETTVTRGMKGTRDEARVKEIPPVIKAAGLKCLAQDSEMEKLFVWKLSFLHQ